MAILGQAEPGAGGRPPTGQLISGGWVPDPWPRNPGRSRDRAQGRAPAGRDGTGRHRRVRPPLLAVPSSLRGARTRPRLVAVAGVLLIVLAAALVLGVRVAFATSAAQPEPVPSVAATPSGLTRRSVPAAFASATGAATPSTAVTLSSGMVVHVVVHVVGQVRRPGVVRLPPGARVLDAVRAAGGPTTRADLARLNLARVLLDGEQVQVPRPGEQIPAAPAVGGPAPPGGATPAGALVNLNTADRSALDTLPGVGPVLAQRILDWRTQHARFSSIDELGEVSGIGDKLLAQLAPKVTL